MLESGWKNIQEFLWHVVVMFSAKSFPKVSLLIFVRLLRWTILPLSKDVLESLIDILRMLECGIREYVQLFKAAKPRDFRVVPVAISQLLFEEILREDSVARYFE